MLRSHNLLKHRTCGGEIAKMTLRLPNHQLGRRKRDPIVHGPSHVEKPVSQSQRPIVLCPAEVKELETLQPLEGPVGISGPF